MKSVRRSGRKSHNKFQNTTDDPIYLDSHEKEKNDPSGKKVVDLKGRKHIVEKAESSKSATKRKRSQSGLGVDKSGKKKRKVLRQNKWFGIRTRSSPHQLYLGISKLKKKRRQAVKDMGFGKMLSFNVDGIPAKLGHYVVDNFDANHMEIKVTSGKIKVDSESMHHLLGIPNNGIVFDSLIQTMKLEATVQSWRDRYPIEDYVAPSQIVNKIIESEDDDSFNFKLDFLMLFITTMVDCLKHGKCKEDILNSFTGDTDFGKIDWCSYVVESMKTCKTKWRRCDVKSPFTGPLAILTLLYVDSIECSGMSADRGVKAIEFWTKDRLKSREDWEINNGGFGIGKIIGLSVQLISSDYETDEIDEVSDNDGFAEQISKANKMFEVLLVNKNRFEKTVGAIYKNYSAKQEVLTLKQRYESMLEDKHEWPQPITHDIDNVGISVQNILEELNKCDKATRDKEMDDEPTSIEDDDNEETDDDVVEENLKEGGEGAGSEWTEYNEVIKEASFHSSLKFMLMKKDDQLKGLNDEEERGNKGIVDLETRQPMMEKRHKRQTNDLDKSGKEGGSDGATHLDEGGKGAGAKGMVMDALWMPSFSLDLTQEDVPEVADNVTYQQQQKSIIPKKEPRNELAEQKHNEDEKGKPTDMTEQTHNEAGMVEAAEELLGLFNVVTHQKYSKYS